jgi:hypothetical protein
MWFLDLEVSIRIHNTRFVLYKRYVSSGRFLSWCTQETNTSAVFSLLRLSLEQVICKLRHFTDKNTQIKYFYLTVSSYPVMI